MSTRDLAQGHNMDEWANKIHEFMDEMHKRTFVQFRHERAWQPATNVYETEGAYVMCVDLAGMEENDISVECVDASRVRIAGRRDKPRPEDVDDQLSVHVMEIDEGPFRREIDLPVPVDVNAVQAKYRKGFLWIFLPKTTT